MSNQAPEPSDAHSQVLAQDARQAELDRLYEADGRGDPAHPQHSLYTGLVAGATTTEQEMTDGHD